jgi:hypothetical protein
MAWVVIIFQFTWVIYFQITWVVMHLPMHGHNLCSHLFLFIIILFIYFYLFWSSLISFSRFCSFSEQVLCWIHFASEELWSVIFYSCVFIYLFIYFETGSHYVTQAVLELIT